MIKFNGIRGGGYEIEDGFLHRLTTYFKSAAGPNPYVLIHGFRVKGENMFDLNSFMQFVTIPAGEFLKGSDNQVEFLPEYEMGLDPVTNAQYKVFTDATGYRIPLHWKNGEIPEGLESHPVVYVSYDDAKAFCKWLSQETGENIDLPTNDEWEKAARGTDGRTYPWGNEAPNDTLCNYDCHVGATTPVGAYSPQGDSPYGCRDMAGNVWEWVND